MGKGKARKDLQGGGKGKLGASATVCRYRGLEVLCHKDTITPFREGRITLDRVLQSDAIFTNARQLQQVSRSVAFC